MMYEIVVFTGFSVILIYLNARGMSLLKRNKTI
jgi:uncharacterized protein YybS (DUF2232 family)